MNTKNIAIPSVLFNFLSVFANISNITVEENNTIKSTTPKSVIGTSPKIVIGSPSTIQILNMFVPIMFPNAISNSCFLALLTVIVSSGRLVPITIKIIVIILSLTPILLAIIIALSTIRSLDCAITNMLIITNIIDFVMLYFGFSFVLFLFVLTMSTR